MYLELLSTKLFRYEVTRFQTTLYYKINWTANPFKKKIFLRSSIYATHSTVKEFYWLALILSWNFPNGLKKKHYKKIPLTFQDLNEMSLKPQQINYFLVLECTNHTTCTFKNIIYFIFAILYIFESSLLLLDGHLHDHEIFFF